MKTIIWDVDDVLSSITHGWLMDYLKQNNEIKLIEYKDLTEMPPLDILNISSEEYLSSLDAFRKSKGHDLQPNKEVLSWFQLHGDKYRHAVLTAAPRFYAPVMAKWVIHYFGNWIRTFHFVPSPRNDDNFINHDNNKGDFIKNYFKPDLFIDDSDKNINDVQRIGVKTMTYPQPWNRNASEDINTFLEKINQTM